jgi:hypothetical protein
MVYYGNFPIPNPTIKYIYAPYLIDLKLSVLALKEISEEIDSQVKVVWIRLFINKITNIVGKFIGFKSNLLEKLL